MVQVEVMELDLSSLASVRSFAEAFKSKDLPLNILMFATSPPQHPLAGAAVLRLITFLPLERLCSFCYSTLGREQVAAMPT